MSALERVRKLLALADSPNIHEAAEAAAMASALMERHSIDMAAIEALNDQDKGPTAKDVERRVLHEGGRVPGWLNTLAYYIARTRRCRTWTHDGNIHIAGIPNSLDEAQVLFDGLVSEIERLYRQDRPPSGGRRWANSFRIGAAQTIGKRLQEARKIAQTKALMDREQLYEAAAAEGDAEALLALDKQPEVGTSTALVVVNQALVLLDQQKSATDQWVSQNLRLGKGRASRVSSSAGFAAGRAAGNRANLC